MKQLRQVPRGLVGHLRTALNTQHGRIVLVGLFVGLCYFPVWLSGLVVQASQGSAGLPLISATVYLGLRQLWKQRHALAPLKAPTEDRLLGHILILSAAVLFPFFRTEIWSQAALWLIILAGIACSSWGASFFVKQPLPVLLMTISVYPKPGVMARTVWQTLTPPNFLENFMAWIGAIALQLVGQPATSEGRFVILPAGAVEVDWGCNGFNMAFTMAASSLILGLFLKQSTARVIGFMGVGVVLALIFNVPRIMLLAIAAVNWGDDAFNFWHGPMGGQIFSGVLFTVYYYVVMGWANRCSIKSSV